MVAKKSKVKSKNLKVNNKETKISRPSVKTTKSQTNETNFAIPFYNSERFTQLSEKIVNFKPNRWFYIILVIVGIALLLVYKKELIIAGMVNGQPISNIELQLRLNKQYRSQVLDQMVTEKIIMDEAIKNNAVPSASDIDNKISQIETQVGGAQALDSLLTQQNQTRASIREQIKLPLAMEKLYGKEATVSAAEVESFIETNKSYLKASDSASQAIEAENILKQQKLSQISAQKFQELKQKAKIQTF